MLCHAEEVLFSCVLASRVITRQVLLHVCIVYTVRRCAVQKLRVDATDLACANLEPLELQNWPLSGT